MSGYGKVMGGIGYANQAKSAVRPVRRVKRKEKVKLSLKQRFRNWLNDTDDVDVPQLAVSEDKLSSEGMRMHVYKASGGFVVETRKYDHKSDRHNTTLHVITEDEDLGERMGKIVMMEALRG